MQIIDGVPKFKAVSGFVYFGNMIEVMNIHQSNAGVTPLASAYMDKYPANGVSGFYVAFNAQVSKKDLVKLDSLMIDMMVNGVTFEEETK